MSAPLGNKFWQLRSKHGRDKLFSTPELLWEAAVEYFEWIEDNPLKEEKVFNYQGEIVRANVSKMRAMTLSGLCLYLHCNDNYFRVFKNQLPEGEQDFNKVISEIESVIYNQKFQGASADLLNANIISMELGLRQKIDNSLSNPDGTPIYTPLNDTQVDKIINEIRLKSANV
jgi:hypothetical protein